MTIETIARLLVAYIVLASIIAALSLAVLSLFELLELAARNLLGLAREYRRLNRRSRDGYVDLYDVDYGEDTGGVR